MKRNITLGLLLLAMMCCVVPVHAQRFGGPERMKGKIIVGGHVGAGYSGRTLHFSVSPQVGYRLTRSLELGTRLGYSLSYHAYTAYGTFFNHYFSGALYGNYEIFRGLYVHAEDEVVCGLVTGPAIETSASRWYNSVLVGGGYRQYSGSSYVFYSLLYDLSWDYLYEDTPYANPFIVRMGVCFALDGKRK